MTLATSKLTVIRRSFALAAVIAASGFATSAFAAPSSDAPTVAVRYDDLNLTTTQGVNTLYSRISHAASQVCPDLYSRDLTAVAAAQRCKAEAIAQAVRGVNNQKLALVHANHVARG